MKRLCLVWIIVGVIGAAGCQAGPDQSKGPPDQSHSQQSHTQPLKPPVKAQSAGNSSDDGRAEELQAKANAINNRIANATDQIAWLNWILAGIGILEAFVLIAYTRQTYLATKAATKAAEAAARSASVADKDMRLKNRAILEPEITLVVFALNQPIRIRLTCKNTGFTPAMLDEVAIGLWSLPKDAEITWKPQYESAEPTDNFLGCVSKKIGDTIDTAHESLPIDFEFGSFSQFEFDRFDMAAPGGKSLPIPVCRYLVAYGRLIYRDLMGTEWRIGFARYANNAYLWLQVRRDGMTIEDTWTRGPEARSHVYIDWNLAPDEKHPQKQPWIKKVLKRRP